MDSQLDRRQCVALGGRGAGLDGHVVGCALRLRGEKRPQHDPQSGSQRL